MFGLRCLAAGVIAGGLCACAIREPARPVAASEPASPVATAANMTRTAEALRGRSREDVIAALGPATIIRFDSGYEVWVYRFVEPAPRKPTRETDSAPAAERDHPPSELVMLLTPAGVVAKIRVRSASP